MHNTQRTATAVLIGRPAAPGKTSAAGPEHLTGRGGLDAGEPPVSWRACSNGPANVGLKRKIVANELHVFPSAPVSTRSSCEL
jgi:hypothetical protein